MLRPTSDFKDMNDFIAQFKKKPAQQANGNWQLANSQQGAVSNHRSANWEQEAGSSQGEPGQAQHPGQDGTVSMSQQEALNHPDAVVVQDGPYPNVTDDYVLARDGSLVHPRQMEWQVEDRIKKQLGLPRDLYDEAAIIAWHRRQLALLEKADAAPRCEHVFMDGTTCQSPRMKKHKYCYAHARMLEVRPKKLKLLPAEDENSIMWNIMEIERALVDDEISEKKAGLLLYGQQLALIAARGVTFKQTDGAKMVRVMPKNQNHTTDHTDGTDQNQKSESGEPQRTQRNTENRVIGSSDHRAIGERGKIPGDESDKSLFSGDEAEGDRVIGSSGHREIGEAKAHHG